MSTNLYGAPSFQFYGKMGAMCRSFAAGYWLILRVFKIHTPKAVIREQRWGVVADGDLGLQKPCSCG